MSDITSCVLSYHSGACPGRRIRTDRRTLFELALPGGFGFLLAAHAGLLVMLSLAKLCLNAALEIRSLEPAKSAVYTFIFLDFDFGHLVFPPP